MPVFDTPVTTNDAGIANVLDQDLPVVLYFFNQPNPALDKTIRQAAKDTAGELLIVRLDTRENPDAHKKFGKLHPPALVTLDEGHIESKAESIQPADVDAHVDFLLGEGPFPTETVGQSQARESSGTMPVHVSDKNFAKEVLHSDVPVLVDFWAPWCGPRHMIAPVLDRIADKYAGKVKIAKLNVDENPKMARKYRAMSIPLMVLFKDGKNIGQLVGAQPQPNIELFLRKGMM